MSDELAKLRADLEVFERYGLPGYAWTVQKKMARLEAEQADPWREHRASVEFMRKTVYAAADVPKVVAYVDYLTAENDRLAARVAELEAANEPPFGPSESEIQAIRPQDEQAIMDAAVNLMNGLGTDPDDPILDPARVLATACELLHQLGGHWQAADARAVWRYSDLSFSAKPYRLKGGSE